MQHTEPTPLPKDLATVQLIHIDTEKRRGNSNLLNDKVVYVHIIKYLST